MNRADDGKRCDRVIILQSVTAVSVRFRSYPIYEGDTTKDTYQLDGMTWTRLAVLGPIAGVDIRSVGLVTRPALPSISVAPSTISEGTTQ